MVTIGISIHLHSREMRDTIADFVSNAMLRTIQKITHPVFGLYASLPVGGGEQFQVIYHDEKNGYGTERVTSHNDGITRQQWYLREKGWSSCVLWINGQSKTVQNILHPLKPGHIVPDFLTYAISPKDVKPNLIGMKVPNSY